MENVEDTQKFDEAMRDYGKVVLSIVEERNRSWGNAWEEIRSEGLEDFVHAKAHRLCNCPPPEKRECLIDLLAYATKRWQRGFDEPNDC